MRKFWHLGSFGVQAENMGSEKRRRKNRKLMARPFILLTLASFPNLPATIFQSSKSAPYILPSGFWLHSVGDRMECWLHYNWNCNLHISILFNVHSWKERGFGGGGQSYKHFLTGHYKAVTSTSHSCPSTYVNYGLLLSQKIQFSVKTKKFSSTSNKWLRK